MWAVDERWYLGTHNIADLTDDAEEKRQSSPGRSTTSDWFAVFFNFTSWISHNGTSFTPRANLWPFVTATAQPSRLHGERYPIYSLHLFSFYFPFRTTFGHKLKAKQSPRRVQGRSRTPESRGTILCSNTHQSIALHCCTLFRHPSASDFASACV